MKYDNLSHNTKLSKMVDILERLMHELALCVKREVEGDLMASFTDYLIEYNVGVSLKKVYEVKRIDLDYFED